MGRHPPLETLSPRGWSNQPVPRALDFFIFFGLCRYLNQVTPVLAVSFAWGGTLVLSFHPYQKVAPRQVCCSHSGQQAPSSHKMVILQTSSFWTPEIRYPTDCNLTQPKPNPGTLKTIWLSTNGILTFGNPSLRGGCFAAGYQISAKPPRKLVTWEPPQRLVT